ncbi:MAG: leucyl/phenylalanyl-tRNA--protein transferase [Akkermansia sp.]|nr:leucyl/phenylalanyl-tRNA--protein transferase [Akkermansia sp.]
MAVYQLDEGLWFPDPHLGEPDGLVAVGGDLSVPRLLLAYCHGFFPWFSFKWASEPHWYCPMQRYVIFPKEIHISHSMRQLIRQQKYEISVNQDFEGVIRHCSTAQSRNEEEGAWLGTDMMKAYTELYKKGFASSVEVWEPYTDDAGQPKRRLVGGLYGVTLRNAFFGESMFSLVPNASKLALISLAQMLESLGWHFIDCQFETPLFRSMGGRHIAYEEYMRMLES